MAMAFFLIVLLALHLCQASAKLDGSNAHYDFNAIQDKYADKYADISLSPANEHSTETDDISDDKTNNFNADAVALSAAIDNIPFIHAIDGDKTELQFRQPIEWLNVNQLRNAIILKFHSPNANYLNSLGPEELNRLRILHENSIRLGKRAFDSSLSGFSSSYPQSSDKNTDMRVERNHQVVRDSRGDNFMRFGRSINGESIGGGSNDFMRFGRSGGNNDFMRFGRGQDFMRFGRSPAQDFMRFGRSPGQDFLRFGKSAGQDFLRFGRSPEQDFMRFGRWPGQDFMRFGRSAGQDFLRFGRSQGQDFMRFGRSPTQDFMRFGKSPAQDFMRFGRSPGNDFIRFGRTPSQDFMRFGRSSLKDAADSNSPRYSRADNFMRFGRTPQQSSDFMRFGKSPEKAENLTNSAESQMAKNELKQAVKLIHEADKNADSGDNPVDKAIKVLFDKHQEQNQDEQDEPNSMQHEDSNDSNMETEYFLKNLK